MAQQALTGSSQVTTITDELADVRAGICEEIRLTIEFRKRIGEKYSSDTRNPRAVQLLTKLLDSAKDVPDHLVSAFDKRLDEQTTDEPYDSYLRAVGFRYAVEDCSTFVKDFISDPQRFVKKWNTI
jgi:hypothetical protein